MLLCESGITTLKVLALVHGVCVGGVTVSRPGAERRSVSRPDDRSTKNENRTSNCLVAYLRTVLDTPFRVMLNRAARDDAEPTCRGRIYSFPFPASRAKGLTVS